MFKRLKAAWAVLCRAEGDIFDRVAEEQATVAPKLEPFTPEALTSAECRVIFDFVQNLLMSWAIKLYPEFDIYRVQAADPEVWWQMLDFDARVQTIAGPVRAEAFRWFMSEYAQAFNEVVIASEQARVARG